MVRQRLAPLVAAIVALLGVSLTPTAAYAYYESGSFWQEKNWSVGGGNHSGYVWSFYEAYDCAIGFKVCARGWDLYADNITFSGAWPNLSRVKESLSFGGSGLNVTVGTGGVDGGFQDLGQTCQAGEFSYGQAYSGYVSSRTVGEVCNADTVLYISGVTASNYHGVRYGSSWSNNTAAASHNISAYN